MATTPRSLGLVADRPQWLPWAAFPFQSRFADISGKRIHYIDEGSGRCCSSAQPAEELHPAQVVIGVGQSRAPPGASAAVESAGGALR
jgi:hypothetical protein